MPWLILLVGKTNQILVYTKNGLMQNMQQQVKRTRRLGKYNRVRQSEGQRKKHKQLRKKKKNMFLIMMIIKMSFSNKTN